MMKNIISFVCLLALLVSGCSQEEIAKNNASSSSARVFTTSFEQDGSRTYLEGGTSSRWTADDRISVFDGNTLNSQYEFQGETGAAAGDFYIVSKPEGTGSRLITNYAVYPYSENVQITTGGVITTTLPANQHYSDNSFGLGDNTMVAVTRDADDTFLAFKNVCGCLKLQLYGTDVTVKSITLVGNKEEKIAGTATITAAFDEAPAVSLADDATAIITLDCDTEGVELGASAQEATAFWMVIPPTVFSNGFTLTVKDLDNKVFTLTTDKAITIARNVVKQVVPVEVVMGDSQTLVCNLPRGEVFHSTIKSHLAGLGFGESGENGLKGIKFIASSTPSNKDFSIDCEGEDAYLEKVEDSLYIHTAASEFVFNEDCSHMFRGIKNISGESTSQSTYMSLVTSIDFNQCINTANVTTAAFMFSQCHSLLSLDLSGFDTGRITDMQAMFSGCESLSSLGLSTFDTHNVTNMIAMFAGCRNLSSLDLSNFDTSNVVNMQSMFASCFNLSSLDLSGFDTQSVMDMGAMFWKCGSFTSLDLKNFDTGNVTDMYAMFSECSSLASLNISSFNTANVTNMSYMFSLCSNLTSIDLSSFDTSKVTDMQSMFGACSNLLSLDLTEFKTGSVTKMGGMFGGCNSLLSLDLSKFDTSNVTDMRFMFGSCSSFVSLDLSNFDTSNVTDMAYMFDGCSSLLSLDLSSFDTSNVTAMSGMFSGCSSFTSLDLSGFDTSNVTDMSGMFDECTSLTTLDLSSFTTGNVTNMGAMFYGCSSLASLDLSSFDTGNVTNMRLMFYGCSSLTELELSNFDTRNVTYMSCMFQDCSSLTALDLSGFNTSNVTDMQAMFAGCINLDYLNLCTFDFDKVTDASDMLLGVGEGLENEQTEIIVQSLLTFPDDSITRRNPNKTYLG